MNEVDLDEQASLPADDVLRAGLAEGDAVLASARPVLRHLLAHDDHSLFNDEVVARVRGMVHDVAHRLLLATADAAGHPYRIDVLEGLRAPLVSRLYQEEDFLCHCHALTMEARLAERLQRRSGVDAVLSSLLQDHAAATDAGVAALSMSVIAAQARHMQRFRRMELPLGELPGDLFHRVLVAFRESCGPLHDAVLPAEQKLRGSFDEGAGRLALLGRLVATMGRDASRALALDHAGLAAFCTALAMASRQPRDLVVFSLGERQTARLALALRGVGLRSEDVEAQFRYLHPDAPLPQGLASLDAEAAQRLLSASAQDAAG